MPDIPSPFHNGYNAFGICHERSGFPLVHFMPPAKILLETPHSHRPIIPSSSKAVPCFPLPAQQQQHPLSRASSSLSLDPCEMYLHPIPSSAQSSEKTSPAASQSPPSTDASHIGDEVDPLGPPPPLLLKPPPAASHHVTQNDVTIGRPSLVTQENEEAVAAADIMMLLHENSSDRMTPNRCRSPQSVSRNSSPSSPGDSDVLPTVTIRASETFFKDGFEVTFKALPSSISSHTSPSISNDVKDTMDPMYELSIQPSSKMKQSKSHQRPTKFSVHISTTTKKSP